MIECAMGLIFSHHLILLLYIIYYIFIYVTRWKKTLPGMNDCKRVTYGAAKSILNNFGGFYARLFLHQVGCLPTYKPDAILEVRKVREPFARKGYEIGGFI